MVGAGWMQTAGESAALGILESIDEEETNVIGGMQKFFSSIKLIKKQKMFCVSAFACPKTY